MTHSAERFYRFTFLTAAVYDIVLGIVFIFFHGMIFQMLGIRDAMPPGAYLSLLGAFLLVIGIAYLLIYRGDFHENRDLITVGVLYKAAYCLVGFVYYFWGAVPHMAFVFVFGIADLIFLAIMLRCRIALSGATSSAVNRL